MLDKSVIRLFEPRDVPAVLLLMKELALFEGYLDDFAITEQYLIDHGFGNKPMFQVLVAEIDKQVVGYGAFYTVPFTFKARPKIVLKELYFSESSRGSGLATALFEQLQIEAISQNACAIEWLVLKNNHAAQTFYTRQLAQHEVQWQHWRLPLP